MPLQTAPETRETETSTVHPIGYLPRDIADFTARDSEVAAVTAALTGTADPATAGPIVGVSGPGGIGKTTLAVHVAHLLRDRYPDGQVYVELGGSRPRPVDPPVALRRLRAALGQAGTDLGAGPDQETERLRQALARGRVLVVLDDAASAEQVRPLLPGHPSSAVLVTSRRRLGALPGAQAIDLDLLPDDAALRLLGQVIGAERIDDEPDAAARLVQLCGGLPLAVRAAAARLASRPHWPASRLVARLADPARRLDELAVDDLDVRATIASSYRVLDADSQRAFRLLAALDTPFTTWTVAALLGVSGRVADEVLDVLTDARLLSASRSRRQPAHYRMPELLRLYAQERAATQDGEPVRIRPRRRGHCSATAAAGGRTRPGAPGQRPYPRPVPDGGIAGADCDEERPPPSALLRS